MHDLISSTLVFLALIGTVYTIVGWKKIKDCYTMWFDKSYWKPYNIVEAASWATKALVIVPGLIFGVQVWWFYVFTLITSITLIWASNEKLLPTLVGFNTIWVWISCVSIYQYFF